MKIDMTLHFEVEVKTSLDREKDWAVIQAMVFTTVTEYFSGGRRTPMLFQDRLMVQENADRTDTDPDTIPLEQETMVEVLNTGDSYDLAE